LLFVGVAAPLFHGSCGGSPAFFYVCRCNLL
jgi:hypothetical protein